MKEIIKVVIPETKSRNQSIQSILEELLLPKNGKKATENCGKSLSTKQLKRFPESMLLGTNQEDIGPYDNSQPPSKNPTGSGLRKGILFPL